MDYENKFIQYGRRDNSDNSHKKVTYTEKSNHGNNRKKILAAFMMLLVTTVSLSTASYAWFTANTAVTIGEMELNVGASSGLQISTDAVKWKSAISLEDITTKSYAGNVNRVPASDATIFPVSSAMLLDSNGYLGMYKGTLTGNAAAPHGYYLSAAKETETSGNYIAFDVFVQYNGTEATTKTVYLSSDSDVTETGETGIINSARVAFVVEGIETNADVASSAANVTADKVSTGTTANLFLWEPNANKHNATGISNAALYNITAEDGTALNSYAAIKADIPASTNFDYVLQTHESYLATITKDATTYKMFQTNAGATGRTTTALWSMVPGHVAKVRIYIWLEGQDVDCETNVAGNKIKTNIKFTKNNA